MIETIPVEGYQGISFNQITQVQNQQFNPGEVIARHKNERLFDRRSFSISLPIGNKDEVHEFLLSKRGNIPFKFSYDNLVYTCNEYSFTYLAVGDRSNVSKCNLAYQFDAVFNRENNLIADEGYANPYPDLNQGFIGFCRMIYSINFVDNINEQVGFAGDGVAPFIELPHLTYDGNHYAEWIDSQNGNVKILIGSPNGSAEGRYSLLPLVRSGGFGGQDLCGRVNQQSIGLCERVLYRAQLFVHRNLQSSAIIKYQNFYGAYDSVYRVNSFDPVMGVYTCQLGIRAKDIYGQPKDYEVDKIEGFDDSVYLGKIFVLGVIRLDENVDICGTFSLVNQFGFED